MAMDSMSGGSPMPLAEYTAEVGRPDLCVSRVTLKRLGVSATVGSLYVPENKKKTKQELGNESDSKYIDVSKIRQNGGI